LTPQDKLILETIPPEHLMSNLKGIIEKLPQKKMSRRNFFKASLLSFSLIAGSILGWPSMEVQHALKCKQNWVEITSALRLYSQYNNKTYPVSLDILANNHSGNKLYLEKIPSCPLNNTPYIYKTSAFRGEHSKFIEYILDYKDRLYSTFFGQLLYKKDEYISAVHLLLVTEHIFGIYFSIFWEYNAPPIRFYLDCRNEHFHEMVTECQGNLLGYRRYPLTAGIR